jgi:hypothetical protein
VSCGAPAVAELGVKLASVGCGAGAIVKVAVPTPLIDSATEPETDVRAAGTTAVSCAEDTNVVARIVPFQTTARPGAKPDPLTVKVN